MKGKSKATKIYEVIQEKEHNLTDNHHEFLDLYHRGRAAYMGKDFQRAIATFQQAHQTITAGQPVNREQLQDKLIDAVTSLYSLLNLKQDYNARTLRIFEIWNEGQTLLAEYNALLMRIWTARSRQFAKERRAIQRGAKDVLVMETGDEEEDGPEWQQVKRKKSTELNYETLSRKKAHPWAKFLSHPVGKVDIDNPKVLSVGRDDGNKSPDPTCTSFHIKEGFRVELKDSIHHFEHLQEVNNNLWLHVQHEHRFYSVSQAVLAYHALWRGYGGVYCEVMGNLMSQRLGVYYEYSGYKLLPKMTDMEQERWDQVLIELVPEIYRMYVYGSSDLTYKLCHFVANLQQDPQQMVYAYCTKHPQLGCGWFKYEANHRIPQTWAGTNMLGDIFKTGGHRKIR